MQDGFFNKIAESLSVERLGSYGQRDQADQCTILARYLWNMAVCESLYSPLQLCEVGLRNAIHQRLTELYGPAWYESPDFSITDWGRYEVEKAKAKLIGQNVQSSPASIVAELQFGFWTHLFQDHYESRTDFLPRSIKHVFLNLPKSQHNRKQIKRTLDDIRDLRNKVFHHERVVHWTDLKDKHQIMLEVIRWTGSELHELAVTLDRFTPIYSAGIDPWKEKIRQHWPAAPGDLK
jgi:hypothetical protein